MLETREDRKMSFFSLECDYLILGRTEGRGAQLIGNADILSQAFGFCIMKEVLDRIRKIAQEGLELIGKSKTDPIANFIIYWNDWYSRALLALESAFGAESEMYGSFRDMRVKPQTLEGIRREDDFKRILATHFGSQLGMVLGSASILTCSRLNPSSIFRISFMA